MDKLLTVPMFNHNIKLHKEYNFIKNLFFLQDVLFKLVVNRIIGFNFNLPKMLGYKIKLDL